QAPLPPRPIPLSQSDLATLIPIYLTPSSGHPNDVVQIVGNGFGQNQTNIAVIFDGTIVKFGITANSTGSFKTTFQIPSSATKLGCHNVVDVVKNGISNTVCFTIVL
ncbi:MAG: hypothetical protein HYR87_04590, partial [Thaumarchaeota archaeon]|nr:hypothetical protein [Nitrososphaerota archaeon]